MSGKSSEQGLLMDTLGHESPSLTSNRRQLSTFGTCYRGISNSYVETLTPK